MKQAYEKAKAKVVLFDNSDVITTSTGFSDLENSETGGCQGNGNWEKYHRPCPGNGNDVGYHCPHGASNGRN